MLASDDVLMDERVIASFIPLATQLLLRSKASMMRNGVVAFGIAVMTACGGASSQPLTPDPDPTPTDQDIAALQNAQTSAAAGVSDAGAATPPDPKTKSKKP